jgi:hypothetical protein
VNDRVPRRFPRGEPLRVSSPNPVRDAQKAGHDVGMSRAVIEAKSSALQHKFVRLAADGESAAQGAAERANRIETLLLQVGWAYDGIVDDIGTLEAAKNPTALARRDQILRQTLEEIAVIAELTTGKASGTATWRQSLDAIRAHLQKRIDADSVDAIDLADIDLILERIDHIEKLAAAALRSYLGYVSA